MTAESSQVNILYLDDETINLFIFEELFKDDFVVTTTSSAEEALAIIKDPSRNIQAVFTDLKMNPVGGLIFARRARDENFKAPICMVTAFSKTPDVEDAIVNGTLTAFFSKPIDSELVVREVRRLLNSSHVD